MSRLNEIEEHIARTALGDRAAFSALYTATSAKLFGVVLRVLGNTAEAEDAVQEIYIKIWRNADRYKANGLSPMTWLITIARNHAIDRLRARRATSGGMDEVAALPDTAPGPEALALQSSERAQISACLDELQSTHAAAIRRVYLDGDTYADLAEYFGVPLNTMRTWLRRSLLKLRECLTR